MNTNRQKTAPNSPRAQLAEHLHSFAIHLLRDVRREDLSAGIGPAQLSALSIIVFRGPTTLGKLAEMEQIKAPSMSRVVDALETAGLARRWHDREDRRRIRVAATRKGTALLDSARKRRLNSLATRLENLTETQLGHCAQSIETLARLWLPDNEVNQLD